MRPERRVDAKQDPSERGRGPRYSDCARLIVLPPPCPQSVEPTDFSRADELIEGALAASRSFLKSTGDIGARRSNAASANLLRPHSHPLAE